MAQWLETSLIAREEVGVQVQIPAGLLTVFFSFIVFLLSGLFLFILTADPF